MSALTQAVRRTGLPPIVVANYRYRRSVKTVTFDCVWCDEWGRVPRGLFEADKQRYIDLMTRHIRKHESVWGEPA